jgi:hypothetical protein
MILILSKDSLDVTTENVIDELECMNIPYHRFNGADVLSESGCFELSMPNKDPQEFLIHDLKLENVKAVWFRKWLTYDHLNDIESYSIKCHAYRELGVISSYLFYYLDNKIKVNWLCDPKKAFLNKIKVLSVAVNCGIFVPQSFIINNKYKLKELVREIGPLITKPLGEAPMIRDYSPNISLMMYTEEINIDNIECLPEYFPPALLQEKIHKEFEIRSFFIDGKFFSIKTFTQETHDTQVDMRKYDFTNMNREAPYELPKKIELKLSNLMLKLGLNTGSIDMIFNKGKYTFLEVNPNGQIGPICNVYGHSPERYIAETLKRLAHGQK